MSPVSKAPASFCGGGDTLEGGDERGDVLAKRRSGAGGRDQHTIRAELDQGAQVVFSGDALDGREGGEAQGFPDEAQPGEL